MVQISMKQLSALGLKYIVASIIALFILQEIVIHKYISEPYPSLRMPPFTGSNINEEGYYEVTNVRIKIDFADRDSLVMSPRKFFHDAPLSHHWALVNKFRPIDSTVQPPSYEGYTFLKAILPGFFLSRSRSRLDIQLNPETHEWLREQVYELSPHKKPKKISFYWYRNQYDQNNLLSFEQELTDSTIVML